MAEVNEQFPKKSVFFVLIFFCCLIVVAVGDDQKVHDVKKEREYGPNAAERAIGFTTHAGSRGWSQIKSWMNHAWLNFWPPGSKADLDAPLGSGNGGGVAKAEKSAASKSFETSKTTAEKAAKSAGGMVKKTVEKVKRSMSSHHGEDAGQEL